MTSATRITGLTNGTSYDVRVRACNTDGDYCGDWSEAPSLLATVLLLQAHDRVSDAEAKARADFDLRWKSLPSATTGGSPWDRGGG